MEKSFAQSDPKIVRYVMELCRPEDAILREVRERSLQKGLPVIQVGSMDALHLEVLTRVIGANKAVEIGTLGGYSAICIARGLGALGKLYTFELNPTYAAVAQESFKKALLTERIEILVGPALENLPKIEAYGPFDLVFIDADKIAYPQYLHWAADNLRIGGVVLGDNAFAWGMIPNDVLVGPQDIDGIHALRQFNKELMEGGRFRATILPTGEGLALGVKIR